MLKALKFNTLKFVNRIIDGNQGLGEVVLIIVESSTISSLPPIPVLQNKIYQIIILPECKE